MSENLQGPDDELDPGPHLRLATFEEICDELMRRFECCALVAITDEGRPVFGAIGSPFELLGLFSSHAGRFHRICNKLVDPEMEGGEATSEETDG